MPDALTLRFYAQVHGRLQLIHLHVLARPREQIVPLSIRPARIARPFLIPGLILEMTAHRKCGFLCGNRKLTKLCPIGTLSPAKEYERLLSLPWLIAN